MNENTKLLLRRVQYTLEQIDVHGRENLDHLLGAILTLEQVINTPEKEETDDVE